MFTVDEKVTYSLEAPPYMRSHLPPWQRLYHLPPSLDTLFVMITHDDDHHHREDKEDEIEKWY